MRYVKIDGYESKEYLVTEDGKVFNKDGREMKPSETHDGYLRVRLQKDLPRKLYRVHRIVAETYLENPNNFEVVNHKDNNPKNNNVNNLEWCNVAYNNKHKYQFGYGSKAKKVYQYDLNGNFIRSWGTPKEAEKALNIFNVTAVARGVRKQAGGYYWSYECPSVETIENTNIIGK